MPKAKKGKAKNGREMHYSAGCVICKDGKYLLIERAVPPLGFAGPAGHVDEGETPEQAIRRETKEETGLSTTKKKLLFEEELDWNWCNEGTGVHYWYLYECEAEGELKRSKRETKSAGWYAPEEIGKLTLEPVWEYWFKKLNII